MIIVKLKGDNFLESALKTYKFKIYKTKQNEFLRKRQEFEKPSVKRRTEIKKDQYKQKIKK